MGGENVSVNIPYKDQKSFLSAGYADMQTNDSYVGGLVRQHGNFSFTRVFESGHEVPAYQPETAFRIFQRAIFGNDIATGKLNISSNNSYATTGPSDTLGTKNKVPEWPTPQCYVLDMASTCTKEQMEMVTNGSGLIHDYILIDQNQTHLFPGVGNNDAVPSSTSGSGPSATGSGSTSASSSGAATQVRKGRRMVEIAAWLAFLGIIVW